MTSVPILHKCQTGSQRQLPSKEDVLPTITAVALAREVSLTLEAMGPPLQYLVPPTRPPMSRQCWWLWISRSAGTRSHWLLGEPQILSIRRDQAARFITLCLQLEPRDGFRDHLGAFVKRERLALVAVTPAHWASCSSFL